MLDVETLERQVCAVMRTAVEAAVTELSRLLEQQWAKVMAAAPDRVAPAAPTTAKSKEEENKKEEEEEEESEVTRPEQRQQFTQIITDKFAALMEAWNKDAAEKISMILKVSMCETEKSAAAEHRSALNDTNMNQTSTELNVGQKVSSKKITESSVRTSRPKRKKTEGKLKPAIRKEHDHTFSKADVATHEANNSWSVSQPGKMLTETTSAPEPTSDVGETDVVQDASPTTSKTTRRFKCPSCDKTFALKCLMDRHYLTHSKPHLCSDCGKRFARLPGLIAHSRRHTGEKLYKCSDCGTEFAYKYTFDRHMRQHSLRKPSTHMCMLCENQFTGALALQRHRCCALKKTFVCSLCPETFDCRKRLADHENLHSGDRDFVCEMCGESFFSFSSLAVHRVTHMQKENCCDMLGLGCSDASVLKNHLSKHTGEKLFTCEVCGKGCSHRSALKHHMLTHTGERPYVCETCGKRCGHASALQNHMRIHTGRKPGQQPVCSVCGKKFRCMANLKYHMSIHTGEKPYACDQCDKKFSNPSNLKLHMTIHTGEKMYGCNICGRRFTQSGSLKLHRRIHTGERPYHCLVCGKGFIHSGEFKKHQRGHLPEGPGDGPSEKNAVKN